MDLAIHILLAGILVGTAFCLVMVVYIIREFSKLEEQTRQKIDTMTNNNLALFNKLKDLEHEKMERTQAVTRAAESIANAIKSAKTVNVVDEKPLDFPNEKEEK